MAEDKKSWVKVYTIFDDISAQILKGILEDNDIAVDVFYYQAGSILGLVSPSTARGEIRVESDSAAKARKIITDFESRGS